MEYNINFLAVLVAGIISMPLGFLWYSPLLFGKPWSKLMGIDLNDKTKMEQMKKESSKAYVVSFFTALLMSYVLAHIVSFAGATTFVSGMIGGLWCWLGFVFTTHLTNALYSKKPMKLLAIDIGYYLVFLLIIGGILAIWR